jgi:hypothetical protein
MINSIPYNNIKSSLDLSTDLSEISHLFSSPCSQWTAISEKDSIWLQFDECLNSDSHTLVFITH